MPHGAKPSKHFLRPAACATAVFAATSLFFAAPAIARADALEDLSALQTTIRESNEAYDAATAQVEELQGQINENQAKIAELEAELPQLKQDAADSMRLLYKMQQGSGGLIELVLSADDFNDLVTIVQYLDAIQSHNTNSINQLTSTASELSQARAALDQQLAEAQSAQDEAQVSLNAAENARAELQAQIEAQAAAEAAARQAALEAAAQAQREAEEAAAAAAAEAEAEEAAKEATFQTESGNEATVEVPASADADVVDPGTDKEAFVSSWGARIDAYLAGSPMAGQGTTFAEAAWEYGVDPRLSPAISMVESSQGLYCFLPYNAWGWGSSSWSSWEEAIWEHVEGLSIGYGGQLTLAGAYKYCPPNADFWYAKVLANMERI